MTRRNIRQGGAKHWATDRRYSRSHPTTLSAYRCPHIQCWALPDIFSEDFITDFLVSLKVKVFHEFVFDAFSLLVGRQEEHLACKKLSDESLA